MKKFPKRNNSFIHVLLIALLTLCVFSAMPSKETKAISVLSDNDVYSIICDGISEPNVHITSPASDSVVSQPNVALTGTTERTTQLEVYVNNVYAESISVNPDGPFNSQVALQAGTNTIRLEAYFSCNHTTASFNTVVTYEPQVTPGPGEDIDTNIPGGVAIPPTISNPGLTIDPETGQTDNPTFLERITANLTFGGAASEQQSTEDSFMAPLTSWASVVGIAVSTAVIISPVVVLAGASKLVGLGIVQSTSHIKLFGRIFGIGAIIAFTILLQLP